MLFGDEGGDDIECAEHVHGLRLDDGHEYGDAACLEVFDGCLHGVEAGLVHEADEFHADDDYFGIGGHVFHHLFELVDGAEEDGTVETLDVDVAAHLVGDAAFIAPGEGLVEVGQAGVGQAFAHIGGGHGGGAVAAFDKVAGALHEEDAGDDHTDAYSGEEVDEYGDEEDNNEHHGVGLGDAQQVFEAFEVDDAPADGDEDTGEHGEGHVLDETAQTEEHGEEEQGMNHAAELGAATALDVDDGTHGGTGTGKSAEETGNGIADALSDEFLVAVVLGLGDVVGHDGGEEGVDGSETGEGKAGNDGSFEDSEPVDGGHIKPRFGKEGHGEPRGNIADDVAGVEMAEEGYNSHDDEGDEGGGDFLGEQREEVDDGDGAQSQQQGGDGDALRDGMGDAHEEVDHGAGAFESHKGIELLQDDDDADTAHEAGEDGIGYVADVFAQLDDAEKDLEQSAEQSGEGHADEDVGKAAARGGPYAADEGGGDDGHGTGGSADLAVGATQEGGEKAQHGGSDYAR